MVKSKSKSTKSAPAFKAPKLSPASKPRSKGEVYKVLSEQTGIHRKQVVAVFEALGKVMSVDLAKPSQDKPKVFQVPGLMKVTAKYKPAQPARKGIDPFTKQEKMFKAKPASTQLKIRALKALKAMV
ncbi:MAG: HU family DNA-binding protein [Phycisphaeraceae bacterium]|jgi:hypothetical protein|nr:HU family DNA-binding protein [Phycisphaeraceae bacterium]